ncbi:zinc ribbon domain-containing protein [Enterobacter cloacae]|uniref:ORC-CDC6 family AAA ATPase n=1 Tax=Enterobacter cloacae TaxID=550 RepID=UPI002FFAB3F8
MSADINESFLDNILEQRADYISDNAIVENTAVSDYFQEIIETLLKKQTTLIVGPRGCGKTHMMRYAYMKCIDNSKYPLAIYVSFNKYYRLEPMLFSRTNAINLFHTWVLARIILSVYEHVITHLDEITDEQIDLAFDFLNIDEVKKLVDKLERSMPLNSEELIIVECLSISRLQSILYNTLSLCERKRVVLLLDDAALTLTPDYMTEFFDIFRAVKNTYISLKASVYPGTTEYGARFHPHQEGSVVQVWLSVNNANYLSSMIAIANTRIENFEQIPQEVCEFLAYAAFGIPRAYLFMLLNYKEKNFSTAQQGLNKIVQTHYESLISEFETLAIKSPKLKSIIEIGGDVFKKIIIDFKKFNDKLYESNLKQIILGVTNIDENPMVTRMFNLLVEAGLLYNLGEVSHGDDRSYARFIPHISALIDSRAFSGKNKGGSAKQVNERLSQKNNRQPLRRSAASLIDKKVFEKLRFDLPACIHCGTQRINISQKFCHNCGTELIDGSIFEKCMSMPFYSVPGLTSWQIIRIKKELAHLKTIGDFLSIQDPGTELRKIKNVGKIRAEKIINLVSGYIDDFLQ